MPKTYATSEPNRSDRDRMAENTDSCVSCGRPRAYPICRECQDEDAAAFAEDMANGNPWTDDTLPLPVCRSVRRADPYAF